jgi:hypothetical protein
MRIYLDLDGVIVAFAEGVIKWYDLNCTTEDITGWGVIFKYFPGSEAAFWEGLTTKFWLELKFTREANQILTLLKPIKPCILTSPPHNGAGGKQQWIRKNLPDYFKDGRYLIGPAKQYLAHNNALLIDDSDENIDKFENAGGHAILVPRPWNRLRGNDIMKHIKTELKRLFR